MKKSQIKITTLRSKWEIRELINLFELAFGLRGTTLFLKFHGREPIYQRDYSKVVKCDNKIVSHVLVIPCSIRIGLAVVQVGVIGYVATHPDYRRKGLATVLMNEWIKQMTKDDYHLSYVFGIPYFYQQFGYELAFFGDRYGYSPTMYMNVKELRGKKIGNKFITGTYEERGLSSVSKLYDYANRQRTGSLVRTEEFWRWLIKGLSDTGRVKRKNIITIKESANQLFAYAMINPDDEGLFVVWEVATANNNEEGLAFLLRAIVRQAQEQNIKRIYFKLPLDHPFLRYCVANGAIPTSHSYGVYARVINLSSLFHVIIPELEKRLRCSSFKDWQGVFGIRTNIGSINLNVAHGTIAYDCGNDKKVFSSLHIPQNLLIQLITGYTDVTQIVNNRRVKIGGGDLQLWRTLFPKLYPYIWAADGGY